MKKLIILLIFLEVTSGKDISAQAIDPLFFGQNYWYANQSTDFSSTVWAKVEASGCKILRYGGIAPNLTNDITIATQFRTNIVDRFNSHNMAAIVQLPYDPSGANGTLAAQAVFTKSVVADLKANGYGGLMYSIANEPENPTSNNSGYGYDLSVTANLDLIIQYIKAYAEKIKEADENAIIIAPDFASFSAGNQAAYDYIFNGTGPNGNIGGTISGNPNSAANGKMHADIASFHMYPQSTISFCDSTNCTGDRTVIISYPSASFSGKLSTLKSYIGSRKIAVTEYSTTGCADACSSWNSNPVPETDARSFIAGQMIADLMSVGMSTGDVKCMNMWSVKESTPDRGFLKAGTDQERSSYWHFKMLATNFKDTYYSNSYNGTPVNGANYKAFAYKNTTAGAHEVGVIIMNQDIQTSSPRGTDVTTNTIAINFNNSNPSTLKNINVRLGITTSIPEHFCTITRETTMLLVFDTNSPYALLRKEVYNLGDALRTIDTGPEVWNLGTPDPITSQDQFNSYYDAVYKDLVITPASSILEGSSDTKTFRFSNTATINGDFEVPLGATLTLLPTISCP